MESSGNCYPYREVQQIAVRASLDGNAVYGGFPMSQVYQWNTNDNYTSYLPGTELPSSIVTQATPSSSRAPALGALQNMKVLK